MENLGEWDHSADHPDYDPNLLNVESWGTENHQTEEKHGPHMKKKRTTSNSSWGDQWSALGVTDFDDGNAAVDKEDNGNGSGDSSAIHLQQPPDIAGIPSETVKAAMEAAVAAISESPQSGDRTNSENNAYMTQHLHPLGIQSSASCPAPSHPNAGTSGAYPTQLQAQQQQQQQQPGNAHHGLCSIGLSQALERSITTPAVSTTAAPASSAPDPQHMTSLAANFMLAQAADSSVAATAAAAAAALAASNTVRGSKQHDPSVVTQPSTSISTSTKASSGSESIIAKQHRSNVVHQYSGGAPKTKGRKTSAAAKKKGAGTETTPVAAPTTNASRPPPFYLFDAPIELRANFMQNQRRLGLPIQQDPNSYHYGESVNGFHPHQYQLPFGAAAATTANARPNAPPPPLIDARHGNHRKSKNGQVGQVKNEREQKRAQKITELIEQLRLQMEEGGWQVEARSKFHTLSNCAQYIKHMIKLTTDKEKENKKLNEDLEDKRRKLERETEEKAMQEGRSDPESVTSSLTSDTTISTARHKQEEETSRESGGDDAKKRKLPEHNSREGGSFGEDSNNNSSNDTNNKKVNQNKKRRTEPSEATTEESSGDDHRGGGSGSGSGSGNSRTGSKSGNSGSGSGTGSGSGNSGSGGPSAQGCSISKTISTVSELTDSNRGSSSNNSGSGGGSSDDQPTEKESRESISGNAEDVPDNQPSNSSISSDAAVASEKTSRDRHTGHKDVVFNNDKRMSRKRPPEEVTSLERSFELNYEEVFDKSNIPQLIASTSGRIVTWNECFTKATGYRKAEIERMTIFSLVKPEHLASFFEIVAAALRPDDAARGKGDDLPMDDTKQTSIASSDVESRETKPVTVTSGSSQDSVSGHDTVKCSNNDKDSGCTDSAEQSSDCPDVIKPSSESISATSSAPPLDNLSDPTTSEGTREERAKISTPKSAATREQRSIYEKNEDKTVNAAKASTHKYRGGESSKSEENEISSPLNEVSSDHSSEQGGSTNSSNSNTESNSSSSKESSQEKLDTKPEGEESSHTDQNAEVGKTTPRRLLNYTAMTLPCIDFPAMKAINEARSESNSDLIPPLHVTVTLMTDNDPARRCFHCVFTNYKGTNGALGIITPELLASLFAHPLRGNRRKKNYYKTHGNRSHQRRRTRVDTTRVGQSVSTSNANDGEKQGRPPSPLLMPPPGPPAEENPKPEENEPKKAVKTK